MTLTGSEQLLLNALKALPPNSVYADAGRKTIFKGFRLYTNRRTASIGWDGDQRALVVNVLDRVLLPVQISLDGTRPVFHCPCDGHRPEEKCEHVVCALLMIVHLLRPTLYRMTTEDPRYRGRLLAGLFKRHRGGGVPPLANGKVIPLASLQDRRHLYPGTVRRGRDQVFRIVLKEAGNGLRCHVEKDGEKVESGGNNRLLPAELGYLMNFSRRDDMSAPLSMFLRRWGNDYEILYHDGKGTRKVRWSDDISCTTWTEFDASVNEILLRKGCAMGEDHIPALPVGNFAFNKERTRMCYVWERHGWGLWDMIRDACLRDPRIAPHVRESKGWTIHIPKEIFKDFRLSFDKPDVGNPISSVVFKINGANVSPAVSLASEYRLRIAEGHDEEEGYRIKPECGVGDHSFLPSSKILSFVRTVEQGHVPASLRNRKRKPILIDAFFRALTTRNRKALDEALRKVINEETFGSPKFATLARRLIRESVAELKVEETQLHYTDEGWQLFSADREKEVLLFLIPYKVFGLTLFERALVSDIEMEVNRGALLTHLSILNAMAKEHGIDLSLDGHPIEPAAWECEIDATGGTIDWFEIRPEIRCNGQTIGRELWEQALARKGVIYRNGSIQILDEKTLHTLSAITRFYESGKHGGKTAAKEVVSIPRLRIIDLFSLRKQGIKVRLAPQDEEIINRLTQFDRIEERSVPKGLKAELRQYQKEGYYWLSFLYEHRFGACLADDMGLGKTVQALSLLGAIKEGKTSRPVSDSAPFLIVVPPTLIFNWEQEIEKFYPDLKVYVYRGRERSTSIEGCDVILTSYGLVRRDIAKLKDLHFHVVIFDEAQAIKNIFADTTGAVRQLKGHFKAALTGTPVENHIGEYYSIMDLVLPGLLGDYGVFQGQAKQDIMSFLPVVTERTKPFVLRRTKERILKELPPKVEHDVYLELTEKQKKFYNRTVEEVRSTIDDAYRNKTMSQAKIIALTAIMKLRQICLTPQLLVPQLKELSPKMEFLKDKLEELCSESHSSLVFSQFTSFLDLVEGELQARQGLGFRIFRLDGSTPVSKRKGIVEGFQGCEGPAVFLLSLKAGGQGLNLTRATYVFHLDPWWNPAVESQASDRSHRIGQKNKVIVTRLLMRHTVEEKMMLLKKRKLSLYNALMDVPEKSAGRSITREDFNFLLGLD
jgi:superfamily II DNA or RNA helicase